MILNVTFEKLVLNTQYVIETKEKNSLKKALQTHLTPSKCTLSLAFGKLLHSKLIQASMSDFLFLALNPSCEIF